MGTQRNLFDRKLAREIDLELLDPPRDVSECHGEGDRVGCPGVRAASSLSAWPTARRINGQAGDIEPATWALVYEMLRVGARVRGKSRKA
jgi:hypothetical protein